MKHKTNREGIKPGSVQLRVSREGCSEQGTDGREWHRDTLGRAKEAKARAEEEEGRAQCAVQAGLSDEVRSP